LGLLVACGGATSSPAPTAKPSATRVVLASLEKTTSTSFRADMTVAEAITVTGPGASQLQGLGSLAGQTVNLTGSMAAESSQRMRVHMTATVANTPIDVESVLYDGTAYVSTDGGSTFRSVGTSGALPPQVSSENALSYLESVGSATDEGAGTADGVAVERYSATLDQSKMLNLMQSALGSLPAQAQQFLKAMTIKDDSIEVTIDHQGRLVTESGPIDVTMDLGALQPSMAGTTMNIHETIDAHFHDYGSSVTVTKPSVTAG
jgi:hypothetical protein